MSYTATYDASHKVKAADSHATNFFRHIARDADQAAGFNFAQRNPNIDPARTSMNRTMVNDGNGGWRAPVVTQDENGNDRPPSAEMHDYLDARLATVKRSLRKDSVIMRPLVLQLDPEWFDEHNPQWRDHGLNAAAEELIAAQLEWAAEELGHQNLIGYSVHMDETNPQLQLIFTPVTDDGRLAQKEFFKGPGDLQRQHKEHRQALADAGYDVEFGVSARSKEHLSSAQYAEAADERRRLLARAAEDHEKLNEWDEEVRARHHAADDREAALTERERAITEAEEELPRLRRRAVEDGKGEGRRDAEEEIRRERVEWKRQMDATAQQRIDAAVSSAVTKRLKELSEEPTLFKEYIAETGQRSRWDAYVSDRIRTVARAHGVTGEIATDADDQIGSEGLTLDAGDRESVIADGGTSLGADIRRIMAQRQRVPGK